MSRTTPPIPVQQYDPAEDAFLGYLTRNSNRLRFSEQKYRECQEHLNTPYGLKGKKKTFEAFTMINGIIYRESGTNRLRVLTKSDVFGAIKQVHEERGHQSDHQSLTATWNGVRDLYYGVKYDEVNKFWRDCKQCNPDRIPRPPDAWKRVAMYLIDMSDQAWGPFRYICHLEDQYDLQSVQYPLISIEPLVVATAVSTYLKNHGPKEFLQGNNSGEFKEILLTLRRDFGVGMINGNAYPPWTPFEQGNVLIKQRVLLWMAKYNDPNWLLSLLPSPCWIPAQERETVINENGEPPDDASSIQRQIALERSRGAQLPGGQLPRSQYGQLPRSQHGQLPRSQHGQLPIPTVGVTRANPPLIAMPLHDHGPTHTASRSPLKLLLSGQPSSVPVRSLLCSPLESPPGPPPLGVEQARSFTDRGGLPRDVPSTHHPPRRRVRSSKKAPQEAPSSLLRSAALRQAPTGISKAIPSSCQCKQLPCGHLCRCKRARRKCSTGCHEHYAKCFDDPS
ncbi:MAG: hypothetical protein Q9190_007750 [Brigantiaea leucoxantha]